MIFPGIKKIGKNKNWLRSNSMISGVENDYLINMGDGQGFKFFLLNYLIIPETKIEFLKIDFNTIKKEFSFNEIKIDTNSIYITIRELFSPAKKEKIIKALESIITILKKNNISSNTNCVECEKHGNNNLFFLSTQDVNFYLCSACTESLKHKLIIEKETFLNEEKYYFRGLLGAIVFSIPGIIIWLLVAVYLERIGAAIALLMFFLSAKGYELFGGKVGKMKAWILLIVNIIMVILSNYFTAGYILYKKHDISINEIYSILTTNKEISEIINLQIRMSFAICSILWFFLLYIYVKQTRFPELLQSRKI